MAYCLPCVRFRLREGIFEDQGKELDKELEVFSQSGQSQIPFLTLLRSFGCLFRPMRISKVKDSEDAVQ